MGLFKSPPSALPALPSFPRLPLGEILTYPHTLWNHPPRSLSDLQRIYTHSHPLYSAFVLIAFNSLWTWLVGEATGNVSQVDRVWTFLPLMYTAHFTFQPLIAHYFALSPSKRPHLSIENHEELVTYLLTHADHRQLLMLSTQIIWSLRLSFNAYRRGFFNPKSEDYRWEIVRNKTPTVLFKILNFVFIAIIQNILLCAISLPAYYLLVQSNPSEYSSTALSKSDVQALKTSSHLTTADWVLAGACVACVAGEYISDGIQQAYQSWKHTPSEKRSRTKTWTILPFGLGPKALAITWRDSDLKRGFVSEGVWGYSRHPAFALEQSFWLLQGLFPLLPILTELPSTLHQLKAHVATCERAAWEVVVEFGKSLPWWSLAGGLALMSLFISSTILTEAITSPKYPAYRNAYQRRVGMFWPLDTYFKRIWLSCTAGNHPRRQIENELGWNKSKLD